MRRRIVVSLAAAAAVALSACSTHATATGREGDIAFAQGMIPHHEQALEMSELALVNASSAPVVKLARQIKRAQDPEIILMRQWLRDWGAEDAAHAAVPEDPAAQSTADEHSGDHEMPGMATNDDMLALAQSSGADFDRLWLDLMIAHHEGAVEMAGQVAETSDDPEVKALAAAIVQGQVAEIDRMRTLLAP